MISIITDMTTSNYMFVGKRNTDKSKSKNVRNPIAELLKKIYHHNIVLFSNTSYKKLNEDYKFLIDNIFAKVFPGDEQTTGEEKSQKILNHCEYRRE